MVMRLGSFLLITVAVGLLIVACMLFLNGETLIDNGNVPDFNAYRLWGGLIVPSLVNLLFIATAVSAVGMLFLRNSHTGNNLIDKSFRKLGMTVLSLSLFLAVLCQFLLSAYGAQYA